MSKDDLTQRKARPPAARGGSGPSRDLAATREYLEGLSEQHDAANRLIEAARERLQASHDRLELENSDLTSANAGFRPRNEGLESVNDSLQTRIAELSRANDDFVNLLDSVQMAIVILGPDARIRRFTPAAGEMLDLGSDCIGRTMAELGLEVDVPDLGEFVFQVMDSGVPRKIEVRGAGGRWYSMRVRPYRTLGDRFDGAVAILVDIDSFKDTQAAIQSSADRLRVVQDLSPVGIFEADHRGRLLDVNDRFCEIAGRSRADLLGRRLDKFLHAEDLASGLVHFADAQPARRTRGEARLLKPGGAIVWIELAYACVDPCGDSPRLVVGTAQDISERKSNEAALFETERRFQNLADSAPVLIWLHGLSGREFVNRAYREYVGATEEQLLGWGWTEYLHPEDRESYLDLFHRAVAENVAFQAQFRLRSADGHYRWMKSIALPRFDGRGQLTGYVGSSFDVHDMKLAEGALRDADRRKNEFLAMLAHELRNPLAPLRNVIEMLRTPGLQAESLTWARGVMARQVEAMSRMIEDLLDVSRITQGKIQLRLEPADVTHVVRRVVASWEQSLGRRGKSLALELSEGPLMALVDAVRLEQVVGNLIGNAAKFTPPNGHIWVGAAAAGSEWVTIRVRDDGKGIVADELPRIFDLFMQSDHSLDRSQGGLGIGLTLVQRLVELHGGAVSVHSEGLDRGAEFVIRLPRLAALGTESEREAPVRAPAPGPPPSRRILVVDDNLDSALTWAMLLRTEGHEVQVAHDAPGALAIARDIHPEVALVDIGLPGMNGIDLGRLLRAEEGPGLLLVAVSGYAAEEDRRRTREAGFDHHFRKPLEPELLFTLLASPPS